MKFLKYTVLLATLTVAFLSTTAAQACTVRWRVPYGVDGSCIMITKSGISCTTFVSHRGTMMENLIVTSEPQHGSAIAESLDQIKYQPKAGDHGSDSFTFMSDYSVKGKSNVTLDVTVE